ncbi:MAG: hypothetical protein JXR19_00730 [Bacteroidia bacterium]
MRKRAVFIFAFMCLAIMAWTQPRSFSKKPEVFIVELNEYLNTSALPLNEDVRKRFTEKWSNGTYPEEEQRVVIKVCNTMLINQHDVADFVLLEETVMAGKDSVDVEKYDNWMKAIGPAAKSGNQTLLTLLKASNNLFMYNRIYQSETKSWYSSNSNYLFTFKGNRVRISFENIDLICQAQVDQIVIYNTSGSYYLDVDQWEGEKGRVTWERVGFGKDNIYADIQGSYQLQFNRAELNVDSVLYTNKDFLTEELLGTLRDRASSADEIEPENLKKSPFPQFTSYKQDMVLGRYLEDQVQFRGGFAMKGREIISRGSADVPSVIDIYYQGILRVQARSTHFSLKENKITSLATELTILTDSGSIFHPKVIFNLNLENKLLLITRGDEGLMKAPFFDNDHQVEIFVDRVLWDLEQPKIDFDMSVNESAAIIESRDFYKEVRYERISRGMLAYHPLSKMRDYVIQMRAREFTFSEYAYWMGSKETYLKPQIIELADLGYIFFNPQTDSIKVRRKLDHAVLSHMELADYDVIRLRSVIAARSNSFLNLINNNLVVEGVRAFRFSDSQSVYAFPHDQKVVLKSKRRMEFGGRVTAGKFDFYSRAFEFDYYDFDINSDHIDSMRIYTPDFTGKNQLVAVKSVLRDINGTLEIDNKNNKSGLQDYPEYPIFTSRKGAKIAYDKPDLFNGAYHKDEFHFAVDPFRIDSLDNFTTDGLTFPGSFVSAGIIPEFRFEAKIMDDYSLGFERASPPEGYPMYGGLGHGDIDIKLSEEGFKAKGEIQFAGAEISSQDIILLPDSTMALAESYSIRENAIFPNVQAQDVYTRWHPKSDSMFINTNGHDVAVLRDNQRFTGNLIQTSKQLAGNGVLAFEDATLKSKDIKYKPNEVDAEESEIQIGSIDNEKIAFASYNVESHVNFNTRIGEFKANEKGQLTHFPFNAYASSMDEYTWDMDAKTITLDKGPLLASSQSYFKSGKGSQDGLMFLSDKAVFDMVEGVIHAENVPYIDVADSRAFPHDGKVSIEEDADMRPLEQARLIASRENNFHEIYDARLKIRGRYDIGGKGSYVFKDKHATGQSIEFKEIWVKEDSTVFAKGYVKDSLGFTVSPKIAYKGYAHLKSTEEFLRFEGYVKPLHSFTQYPSDWFRYRDQPDPARVIVPAYDLRNPDRRKTFASVSIANDSTHVYPAFFNYKRSYADADLTKDTGVFYYNEAEQTFYVGDSLKLFDGSPRGSYLSFNDATGLVYSEGMIDFGLKVDDHFSGLSAGQVYKSPSDTSFIIDMLIALNIELPDGCWDRMVAVLEANAEGNPDAEHDNTFTTHAVAELVGDRKLDNALGKQALGEINPIGDLNSNLLISKASLHYSPYRRSFVSFEPIQIATVNGKQINKQIDARIQVIKRRSGTRYTMFIEISKYDWFYIDYYLGSLNVYSTDKEFNDIILEQGPKLSKGRFRIRTASPRTVTRFLDKLEPEN